MGVDLLNRVVGFLCSCGLRLDGYSPDGIRDVLLSRIVYLQATSPMESSSHILFDLYHLVSGRIELYSSFWIWISGYSEVSLSITNYAVRFGCRS